MDVVVLCVVWLGNLDECVWVDYGFLLKEVGFSCIFGPGGAQGVEVDAVGIVFYKVEVPCENGSVGALRSDFPADFPSEDGTFAVVVVAGVVVNVDDL